MSFTLNMSNVFLRTAISIIVLVFFLTGCKKLVDVDPPITSTTGASVYTTDNTAIAAVTGLYSRLGNSSSLLTGKNGLSLFAGLSSDELSLFSGVPSTDTKRYYYTNSLHANGTGATPGTEFWSFYTMIFTCNSAIEGLSEATTLTPSIKTQLLGEAKFMRALFYFYLVNLYGDLPLPLTSDYKDNANLRRSPKAEVYNQIIADLKSASDLLSVNYLNVNLTSNTNERVRPTKWAASALLARCYLYTNKFDSAVLYSTQIIGNPLYDTVSLNNVFLKNSKEAIWQLQPVQPGWNTQDGRIFIIPASGPNNNNNGQPTYLSQALLNSFESNDQRKAKWVNSRTVGSSTYYYPFKYKIGTTNSNINATTGTTNITEYLMVLRLGEQYLIRAEARAQQNQLSAAIADLDVIRQRAGLPLIANTNPGISQSSLLAAILHERQVEMFTEFGQRWFDLKRTGMIDTVMTTITQQKGGVWKTTQQLYPLPLFDLQYDPNLVQNTGY